MGAWSQRSPLQFFTGGSADGQAPRKLPLEPWTQWTEGLVSTRVVDRALLGAQWEANSDAVYQRWYYPWCFYNFSASKFLGGSCNAQPGVKFSLGT